MKDFLYFALLFLSILDIFECGAEFKAYWNIPLSKCTNKGVIFDLDKFGIIHNEGNRFYGDQINILYSPGKFPRYSETNEQINGGIPQLADIDIHKETFREQLTNGNLKEAFQGPIVMDFEEYQPSFQITMPEIYREKSIQLMRELHPTWSTSEIWEKAGKTFNNTVKPFFKSLLTIGKQERPNALFGYYHYPYCRNHKQPCDKCSPKVMDLNDKLKEWFYSNSGALYPSLYTFESGIRAIYRTNVMTTRMIETKRINVNDVPVYPYFWYRFKDSPNFLPRSVILQILWIVKHHGGDGVILWGASSDLKTRENCLDFKEYVINTLGPALECLNGLPEAFVEHLRKRYPLTPSDGESTNNPQNPPSNSGDEDADSSINYIDVWYNELMVRRILSEYCEQYENK